MLAILSIFSPGWRILVAIIRMILRSGRIYTPGKKPESGNETIVPVSGLYI
ncbi:MAG TPA: hypothetical protein VK541_05355 [Pedobacter sp.]|uniref:hypothetical protein n=1 Tax=Pedobacter sp. TaxID=1411316 RepID=UPI002B9DBF3A|nr:hypothetical protein [Pedobacter sp.]HMI01886.1 hypothetical protein [Pedobacter sp.]